MDSPTSRRALRPGYRTLICIVLATLAIVQTLGMMHRILHGAHATTMGAVGFTESGRQSGGSLTALFAGHDEEQPGCQLYDQISHADLACGELPAMRVTPASDTTVALHPAWHLAAQASGFLARGPPAQS